MFNFLWKSFCDFNNCKTFLPSAKKYSAGSRSFSSHAHEHERTSDRPPWVDPRDDTLGAKKYDAIINNEQKLEPEHPLDYIRNENRKRVFHVSHLMHSFSKALGLNYPVAALSKRIKNTMHNSRLKDQLYRPERLETLGPDLAAAHFVMCRGGGVKFVGESNFVRSKINQSFLVLPTAKDDTYKVEAIDASKMTLIYEGLKNMSDLKYLKWISFSQCNGFNNWYLDHVSLIAPNIEYLDVSFCKEVDHNGFACLYRLRKLKCINVKGISDSDLFKLACLTLESENPNLVVIGVSLKKKPKSVFTP